MACFFLLFSFVSLQYFQLNEIFFSILFTDCTRKSALNRSVSFYYIEISSASTICTTNNIPVESKRVDEVKMKKSSEIFKKFERLFLIFSIFLCGQIIFSFRNIPARDSIYEEDQKYEYKRHSV